MNFKAALAGIALAACATPGPSVAQSSNSEYRSRPAYPGTSSETNSYSYSESGPDSPSNRDGYGVSSNPYYPHPGDRNYSDSGSRSANAAIRHGTVEAVEIERDGAHSQRIRVRMDDGTSRVFTQDAPELRAGDRVRIERDGHLELA